MKNRTSYVLAVAMAVMAIADCSDSPTRPRESFSECGTLQGLPCPAGETCELPAGQCQVADLGGICVPIPDACTLEYVPVCGCDGVTYGNDCLRLMVGVQKSHEGECA